MERRKLDPPAAGTSGGSTTPGVGTSPAVGGLPKMLTERERLIGTQKRWNCRDENEFLRVLTGYGVDLLAGVAQPAPDWQRFKQMAKLEKKSDDALSDYYKVFIAMCKRRAGVVRLNDEERELDGICEDISEDHARLILDRLELLSKLRELSKAGRLDERLALCQNNFDTPDWWESGRHDRELVRAVLKHGLYRSDYYIFQDPAFTFAASERMFIEEVESHLLKAHLAEIEQIALLDHERTVKREREEYDAAKQLLAAEKKAATDAAAAAAAKANAESVASAEAAAAVAKEAKDAAENAVKKEAVPSEGSDENAAVKKESTDGSEPAAVLIEDKETEAASTAPSSPQIIKAENESLTDEKTADKSADESSISADPESEKNATITDVEKSIEPAPVEAAENADEKTDAVVESSSPSDESAKESADVDKSTVAEDCAEKMEVEPLTVAFDANDETAPIEKSAETTSDAEKAADKSVEDIEMTDVEQKKTDEPADKAVDDAKPSADATEDTVDDKPKSPAKNNGQEVGDEDAEPTKSAELEEKSTAEEASKATATEITAPECATVAKPEEASTNNCQSEKTNNADSLVVAKHSDDEETASVAASKQQEIDETAAIIGVQGGGDPDDDEVMKEKENKAVEDECKKQAADLKARFPDLEVTQPISRPFVKPIVDIKAIKGMLSTRNTSLYLSIQ